MTIEDFLLARIAEEESAARLAGEIQAWRTNTFDSYLTKDGSYLLTIDLDQADCAEYWNHAVRWSPQRVLAECAAKRAIVQRYVENLDRAMAYRNPRWRDAMNDSDRIEHRLQEARLATSFEDCRTLATIYADHPDYKQRMDPAMMPGDTCDWPECTAPAETQEGPMALCRIHLIYFSADPDDWEELVQAERERSPAPTTDPSDN